MIIKSDLKKEILIVVPLGILFLVCCFYFNIFRSPVRFLFILILFNYTVVLFTAKLKKYVIDTDARIITAEDDKKRVDTISFDRIKNTRVYLKGLTGPVLDFTLDDGSVWSVPVTLFKVRKLRNVFKIEGLQKYLWTNYVAFAILALLFAGLIVLIVTF